MNKAEVRKVIVVLAALAMLAIVNISIYSRERLLTNGRVVLLELAPADPRSLMQGDYMALRFKIANDAFRRDLPDMQRDGYIVAELDGNGVASFRRFANDASIGANEVLLRYRIRNKEPKFATNAFFFQEGHADRYGNARYGEFRVSRDGEMILTGLRGADFAVLGIANAARSAN